MRKILIASTFLAIFPLLLSQQTLTNNNIINMVKSSFSVEFILATINRSPGNYDTSADGLVALKNARVDDRAIAAVVSKASEIVPSPLGQVTAMPPVVPQQTGSLGSKRLFIEERIKTTSGASVHCDTYGNCYGHNTSHSRNVSLEVTREVMKLCPLTLIVTDNREAANYVLRITPGASTLYKQDGDVAYVSPTRWKASNLAKDLCNFARAQH